eukprot:34579-Eustigmatos_ZCMA.PRE.1
MPYRPYLIPRVGVRAVQLRGGRTTCACAQAPLCGCCANLVACGTVLMSIMACCRDECPDQ